MKRIGLTGSIGSGKSTVAKLLTKRGIPVLDADAVAREVSSSPAVLNEVSNVLGAEYVIDGGLNRPALAKLVFENPEARAALNAIIHPEVRAEMARRETELEASGALGVVQDIPLLFENGLEKLFDATILVDAPLETRISRVMKRDGLTREQILARDAAQMPAAEKRARADFVLENDWDEASLETQLEVVLRKLGLVQGLQIGRLKGKLIVNDADFVAADAEIQKMFDESDGFSSKEKE
jgi:dephospho-CoA kinase